MENKFGWQDKIYTPRNKYISGFSNYDKTISKIFEKRDHHVVDKDFESIYKFFSHEVYGKLSSLIISYSIFHYLRDFFISRNTPIVPYSFQINLESERSYRFVQKIIEICDINMIYSPENNMPVGAYRTKFINPESNVGSMIAFASQRTDLPIAFDYFNSNDNPDKLLEKLNNIEKLENMRNGSSLNGEAFILTKKHNKKYAHIFSIDIKDTTSTDELLPSNIVPYLSAFLFEYIFSFSNKAHDTQMVTLINKFNEIKNELHFNYAVEGVPDKNYDTAAILIAVWESLWSFIETKIDGVNKNDKSEENSFSFSELIEDYDEFLADTDLNKDLTTDSNRPPSLPESTKNMNLNKTANARYYQRLTYDERLPHNLRSLNEDELFQYIIREINFTNAPIKAGIDGIYEWIIFHLSSFKYHKKKNAKKQIKEFDKFRNNYELIAADFSLDSCHFNKEGAYIVEALNKLNNENIFRHIYYSTTKPVNIADDSSEFVDISDKDNFSQNPYDKILYYRLLSDSRFPEKLFNLNIDSLYELIITNHPTMPKEIIGHDAIYEYIISEINDESKVDFDNCSVFFKNTCDIKSIYYPENKTIQLSLFQENYTPNEYSETFITFDEYLNGDIGLTNIELLNLYYELLKFIDLKTADDFLGSPESLFNKVYEMYILENDKKNFSQ